MRPPDSSNKSWRRRDLIKLLGASAIAGPAIFERTMARAATSKVIKIDHVSSPTGVFAPVAQADPFILDQIRTAFRFWRRLWQQTIIRLSGRSSGRVNQLKMSAKHLWLPANGEREATDLNSLFVRILPLRTLELR